MPGHILRHSTSNVTRAAGRSKRTRSLYHQAWRQSMDMLEPRTLLAAQPALFGNGVRVADKDTSPSLVDFTDFGALPVGGATLTRTFTLKNLGDTNLNLTGSPKVTISGTGAGAFTIVTQPFTTVVPDGSTTFEVRYNPTKSGVEKATIQFATDASSKPFTFAVQGNGLSRVLTVLGGTAGTTAIAFDSVVPKTSNGTVFGSVPLGERETRYFTLRNDGKTTLHFDETPVVIAGVSPADFSAQVSAEQLEPGQTATLAVTFNPTAGGLRSATIKLKTDDDLHSEFTFDVQGTAVGVGMVLGVGNSGIERGNAVALDAAGNIYIAGCMSNTLFLPNNKELTSAAGTDVLVVKFDPKGQFLWAQRVGGGFDDEAMAIAIDADGNVIVAGTFQSTVDFNPGKPVSNLVSHGGMDVFLLKLEPKAGNFIWARSFGSNANDAVTAVATGPGGRIALVGSFQNTADFNPGTGVAQLTVNGATNSSDAFVVTFDKGGNYQWAHQVGSTGSDAAGGVAIDEDGNLYISGTLAGTADFDPGAGTANRSPNAGTTDAFLWKLTSTGAFAWANAVGGDALGDAGRGVTLIDDRVIFTGSFKGTGDFDPGVNTLNLTAPLGGAFVAAYGTGDGSLAWAHAFAGTNAVDGYGIAATSTEEIFIFGEFRGTADMNPDDEDTANLTALGIRDVFLTKLDRDGEYVFALNSLLSTEAFARGVVVDAQDRPLAIGSFNGQNQFNLGDGTATLNSGNSDAFLWKYLPTPEATVTGQSIEIIDDATNPLETDGTDFGVINLNSGTLKHTFVITNTGLSPLNLSQFSLPEGFVLVSPAPESIGVGDSSEFIIGLSDHKAGDFSGIVSFATNNPSQSPFTFAVQGSVQPPASTPTVGIPPYYHLILTTPKPLYNVTVGTLNPEDENAILQTYTFSSITGIAAIDVPNLSDNDRFFLTASSTPNGPLDITTGSLSGAGTISAMDALIPLADDQENLLSSIALFKLVAGKLTPFTSAGIFANPLQPGITFLNAGKGTFTDDDGDTYTITLTGGGFVGIELDDEDSNGQGAIQNLALVNTTPKSSLSISVKKGAAGDGVVNLGTLTGASLKSFSAPAVDITAMGLSFSGWLGSVTLRDTLNQADIRAGGDPALKTSLKFRKVGDGTAIRVGSTVTSLSAFAVGRADIAAPVISKITTTINNATPGGNGSFAANVTVSGAAGIATTLGTVSIAGALTGGYWNITGNAASITAASATSLTLVITGDITTKLEIKGDATGLNLFGGTLKKLSLKGLLTSSLVGVDKLTSFSAASLFDTKIDALSEGSSITTFTLTSTTTALQNSTVRAIAMGTVSIKAVSPDNGGTPFGFTVGSIASYSRTGLATIKNPSPGNYDVQGDYRLRVDLDV